MAFPTAADILLLEEALRTSWVNGSWQVQTIQFSDQSLTLRSPSEAMALLKEANALVSTTVRTRYATTDKGV